MSVDLAEYVSLYMATYGKPPHEADKVLATLGKDRAWFEGARAAVDASARNDLKVAAEINARVTLANAGRAGRGRQWRHR